MPRVRGPLGLLLAVALALGGAAVPGLPAAAESSPSTTRVQVPQTWFSFVRAGEWLHASFENTKDNATGKPMKTKIVLIAPGGAETECTEVYAVGGVCSFAERATADGVWAVEMRSNGEPAPGSNQGRNQMYWSVGPRTGAAQDSPELPGRTWTEAFHMEDRRSFDLSLWYHTEFGYTYEMDLMGFRGINSSFAANAFGNVDGASCASAYRSLAVSGNTMQPGFGPIANFPDCVGVTPYKIFFGAPDRAMPERVTLPSGERTWLLAAPTTPEITELAFVPDTPGSRAGVFSATVRNYEGNVSVFADVDGNGSFDDPRDRQSTLAAVAAEGETVGRGSLAFDGLDGTGEPIGADTPLAFRAEISHYGEVHFTLEDVEELDGGIRVTRVSPADTAAAPLFWNDEPVSTTDWDRQAELKCGSVPAPLDASAGVPSGAGVHGWTSSGCREMNPTPANTTNGGSWGNNRIIDNWTFTDPEQPISETLEVPGYRLSKAAQAEPAEHAAALEEGDVVRYTVTAEPVRYPTPAAVTLPAETWAGQLSDDLGGVFDDAELLDPAGDGGLSTEYRGGATGQAAAWRGGDPAAGLWSWRDGAVPIDQAVAVSYAVRVADFHDGLPAGDGFLLNVAFAHEAEEPPPFPEACVAESSPLCQATEHPVAALRVEKRSDPIREASVLPGEPIQYELIFENGGQSDVVIDGTDWLGQVLDDAEWDGAVTVTPAGALAVTELGSGADRRLRIAGTIPPGATVRVGYAVTVVAGGDGLVRNFLTEGEGPAPEICDDGNLLCSVHFVPGLRLEKRFAGGADHEDLDGSGSVSVGDLLTYRFTATNTGQTVLRGLAIVDPMLAAAGVTIGCAATSLAPGQATECATVVGYEVTAADAEAGAIPNVATAVAKEPGGQGVTSPESDVRVPVVAVTPAMTLEKGVADPGGVVDANGNGLTDEGDEVRYVFTVTNAGDTAIEELRIADGRLAEAGIEVECDAEVLPLGGSVSCRATEPYRITAADAAAGELRNVATAHGTTPAAEVASNEAAAVLPTAVAAPAIALEKRLDASRGGEGELSGIEDVDGGGTVSAGDLIWYAFAVRNAGNVPLSAVGVADELLARAGIPVRCAATELAVAAETECRSERGYPISAADVAAGRVKNLASASGLAPDGGAVVSPEDAVIVWVHAPELALTKTVARVDDRDGSGSVTLGDRIWWEFAVRNTGNRSLTGLAVSDPLLAAAGIAVSCPVTELAPGAETRCASAEGYPVSAADAEAGAVRNVATAAGLDPDGAEVSSPEDGTNTPIAGPAGPGEHPGTGGAGLAGPAALALLLLIGGGALLLARRRRA